MAELADKTCISCRADAQPLGGEDLEKLLGQIPGWTAIEEHHLHKEFSFKNFREALGFVNQVGEVAEKQGHHPDIRLGWGLVEIYIFTHKIDGLTESDFVFAAKVDRLL